MRASIRSRQIWLFFALTLALGWSPWYLGSGSIFYPAPLIAALVTTFLTNGTRGLRAVLQRMVRWRVHLGRYAFVLLIPIAVAFVAIGSHLLLGGTAPRFPIIRENPAQALVVVLNPRRPIRPHRRPHRSTSTFLAASIAGQLPLE